MGWLRYLVPKTLLPDFIWPQQVLGSVGIASSIPPTPRLLPQSVRRVAALPFGLVLKWSDGTRLEEVAATMMARSAGFPVPKIISYADHPDAPHAPVSILMTRIPGKDLGNFELYKGMTKDERERIFAEIHLVLQAIRKWSYPDGKEQICSVLGTAVRSVRIPGHAAGPYASESEFNDHLFSAVSRHGFKTQESFEEAVETAQKLRKMQHPIVFTHGDLKHHNIMVQHGHVTGFLDWESAGWYPDYWEFTTPLRFGPRTYWWNDLVWRLGGDKYEAELESERALVGLTVNSWAW